ncbi:LapA family protein [Psychromonas hadalis]|uniref:LapA family protein n=1 Tax=Psychromonas hadalis TaxID=211669 RepID=UPI0003B6DF03|nr:lipopolysaccharide assembly protein LapA domain-containing protein [Psychromonas hadalis]
MKRFLTLIVIVLLFAIAIVLGLKNQQTVNINYLVAQSEMRLSTLLAINFLFGFIVSGCFGTLFYLRLTMKNRHLRKLNKKQRKALNQLSTTHEKD